MQIILPAVINSNKLNAYIALKDHFFLSPKKVVGDYYVKDKYMSSDYFVAAREKETNKKSWEILLSKLKSKEYIFRIRDMSDSEMHTFKAIIVINEKWEEAIFLHISFLGNLIGLYFAQNNCGLIPSPISYFSKGVISNISYTPFNENQQFLKNELLKEVNNLFSSFIEFDNSYASYKINEVQVYGEHLKNVDLFQVLFSTNVHGIL